MKTWFLTLLSASIVAMAWGQAPPVIPPVLPPAIPPMTPPVNPGVPAPPATAPITTPPLMTPPAMPATPPSIVPKDPRKIEWPREINGKTIDQYLNEFKSSDPTVRQYAVAAIPGFGPMAARKYAVKPLLTLIADTDPGIRANAILTLGTIGVDNPTDATEVINKLAAQLGNTMRGSPGRLHIVRTLGTFGTDAYTAIPKILETTDDPSWETRSAIADALGKIGSPVYEQKQTIVNNVPRTEQVLKREASKSAMSRLSVTYLRDVSASVRMEACQALIALGPPHSADPAQYLTNAKPFIDSIVSRLGAEKDDTVKIWLNLLYMMYDERAFDATMKLLINEVKGPDLGRKVHAMNALAILGPASRPALGAISDCMHHDEPTVKMTAINSILAMGDEAKAAIPDFERLMNETKDKELKEYVGEILKGLRKIKLPPK
ncbi:MAG: HEAT repeat domain-containing protein [Fimbriiglobus sp.]